MTTRALTDDGDPTGGGGLGGGTTASPMFYDMQWAVTAGSPALSLGYEISLYSGTNPDDQTAWLGGKLYQVAAGETRLVLSELIPAGVTRPAMKFSIRDIFPWGKGPWTSYGSTVTPAPLGVHYQPSDNLIPNYNSELGTTPLGVASALVVNDSSNAYAGNYVRKLNTSATNVTDLTGFMPCMPGDTFYFEAMAKVSSGSAGVKLRLAFFTAGYASVSTADSPAVSGTSYGAPVGVAAVVPATAVFVKAQVFASTTAAATFGYFDSLLFRRVNGQNVLVSGSQAFTANGTFTVPVGVTRVRVTAIGGGGGAGGGTTNNGGGGGGGAGDFGIAYETVTPGQTATITIGAAGAGGAANTDGTDGGQTSVSFAGYSVYTLICPGGKKGLKGSTRTGGNGGGFGSVKIRTGPAGAGPGTPGTETIFLEASAKISGAGGANGGVVGSSNGLDGGSANSYTTTYQAFGGVSQGSGGGGGSSFFGNGGDGGNGAGASAGSTSYGAGGGGGGSSPSAQFAGGNGKAGYVLIEWGPGI